MFRNDRNFFLMVMTLMGSVSLLATDIYLPALPTMAEYFNCSQVQIQTSFSLFLVGLAVSQLVYGVLADYFGRKKVTLIGLAVFTIASLFCAFSSSLSEFLIARLFQAIGGGVGSVINRALIADRYDKTEAIKIFSTIFPIVGLSAAIGPYIGGHLTYFFGWQAVFYFMTGFGFLVWFLVLVFLKESKNVTEPVLSLHPPIGKLSGYLSIFRNLPFLGYVMMLCASFSAFRCYCVESPFVFDNQGYMAEEMSSFYLSLSLAYIIGNLTAKRLIHKTSVEKVLNIGFFFFITGGLCMVVGALCFEGNPYAIILPMSVITLGNGFLFPMGSAGAMSSVPNAFSGMASGLMGALQFITAALCAHWVGALCHGQALWMSLFIGGIILIGLCSYRVLILRPSVQTIQTEQYGLDNDGA